MEVRVINRSNNPLPTYQTPLSAGVDLRAFLDTEVVLLPMERKLVPTGLFVELVPGTEAQIRPRSGLAYKHGITVLNSPGTIDADYRGELKVLLINFSDKEFIIKNGERIAQMVVASHHRIEWKETEVLSESERGGGGYGSTGTH